ncbi:hyalin [Apostichopus japonicus]|uniref:Hyalin n=1 Tax=Stichopus japonicus TaxID=307972 RepID=A0A2G8JFT5_STIJA|nr:hyalin [Apostichopus japonicus]
MALSLQTVMNRVEISFRCQTTVRCTCTDSTGAFSECDFSFTVQVFSVDDTPPDVTCIQDITRIVTIDSTGTTVSWTEPTATDTSGVVSLQSRSHAPGDFFSPGTTQVTYIFVDPSGQTAFCIFTVTVTPEDTVPPVVSCIPDVTDTTPLGTGGRLVFFSEPTATDDSGVVSFQQRTHIPGTFFSSGVTQVTYIFVDPAGNTAECTFRVIVTEMDEVLPVVTCPPTFQSQTSFEVPFCIITNLPEAQAFDNSGTVFLLSQNPPVTTTQYTVGDTTVTLTFQDPSGNQGSCTFTVRCMEVDEVQPIVTCPSTFQSQTSSEVPFCTVNNLPEAQAMDNSGTVFLLSQNPPATTTQYTVGDTTVTFTFQDPSGNQGSCTFTVRCIEGEYIQTVQSWL